MHRLLDTIDEWATRTGLDDDVDAPHRFEPTQLERGPELAIDLESDEIGTIIWACGYRADYSWLELPVLDRHQRIQHDGGVVRGAPGAYLLGTKLLRRRSTFINGAEHDTLDLSEHLRSFLDTKERTSTQCRATDQLPPQLQKEENSNEMEPV